MSSTHTTIAVLGGTGAEGSVLAIRLAHAGHEIIIGSRNADKAARVCQELRALAPGARIEHNDYRTAAAAAQIVVLTVPHSAQRTTVEEVRAQLAGKILVDATVPLVPPKVEIEIGPVAAPAGSVICAVPLPLAP